MQFNQTEESAHEQLELFSDSPFSLRLSVADALRFFWENYWRHLPSAKTTAAHFDRLRIFFAGYYLDSVSKADIERLRRHLKLLGYSEPTVNKSHMILSRLFSKFYEYKEGRFVNGIDLSRLVLPAKNPAAQVPKVNERQFARTFLITKAQKKILCSFSDEELHEIIDGLYWSQLRPSDFFRVTSANVSVVKVQVNGQTVDRWVLSGVQHKNITTKCPSGVPYKVPVPEDRVNVIRRRLEATKPGTPLFRKTNLQKRWERVRELAATVDPVLSKAQMRDLRGAGTSALLDAGFDLETVRKKGGWTTVRMIPIYDKRPDDLVVKASEKLVEA